MTTVAGHSPRSALAVLAAAAPAVKEAHLLELMADTYSISGDLERVAWTARRRLPGLVGDAAVEAHRQLAAWFDSAAEPERAAGELVLAWSATTSARDLRAEVLAAVAEAGKRDHTTFRKTRLSSFGRAASMEYRLVIAESPAQRTEYGEYLADLEPDLAPPPPPPPPAAPGTITIGRPTMVGDLDKAIIRRYVRLRLGTLRACYSAELLRFPGLAGTIQLHFLILADGHVADVVTSPRPGPRGLSAVVRCAAGELDGFRFPAVPGMVQVNFPLALRAPHQ
jgi:hypothetical protein